MNYMKLLICNIVKEFQKSNIKNGICRLEIRGVGCLRVLTRWFACEGGQGLSLRASLSACGRRSRELRLFNCILMSCPCAILIMRNRLFPGFSSFRPDSYLTVAAIGAALRLLVLLSLRHGKQCLPAFMAKPAHGFHVLIENIRCIGEGFHCAVNARLPQ